MLGVAFGEFGAVAEERWETAGLAFLAVSAIAGVAMSFLSFRLRELISATSFSVVGNMCKVSPKP